MLERFERRLALLRGHVFCKAALLLTTAACTPDSVLVDRSPMLSAAPVAAIDRGDALPTEIREEEAIFAALSQRVPSSAGYYVDAAGNTVLVLRDSTRASEARQAFELLRPDDHRAWAKGGIRVVRADYGCVPRLVETRVVPG